MNPPPDDLLTDPLAQLLAALAQLGAELRRDAADYQRQADQAGDKLTRRLARAVAERFALDAFLVAFLLEKHHPNAPACLRAAPGWPRREDLGGSPARNK